MSKENSEVRIKEAPAEYEHPQWVRIFLSLIEQYQNSPVHKTPMGERK